jgi:alanyl-tRNA synthetase
MTSREIRQSFLDFFRERGHTIVPSAPVVPYDDPTLLFTNAGMNQFKDVFLGTGTRAYTRAADTQKCIRVSGKHNDLEEVGRDTYHHTFFEMLGNWSFGDYYKKEAIEWAWELLTNVWGVPKHRLWVTVYKDDDEAERLWKSVTDVDHRHVLRFGEKENFWEMGDTGPCGPCSEIHIDRTPQATATAEMVNAGTPGVMEIWNLVFIQYNRDQEGTLHPLPAQHVDTGMGFERICAVLQGRESNYDTDVFSPLLEQIQAITEKPYSGTMSNADRQQLEWDTSMRVVADHVRALTFAIADGALPSNEGRGYVLRRLLRRAARFGRNLEMHTPFIYRLVPTLVETMGHVFPEIVEKQEHIEKIIRGEEEGFNATLDRGLEMFEDVVRRARSEGRRMVAGEDVFRLYDTYGFPVDLTSLLAHERGLSIDEAGFQKLMAQQRERSRAGDERETKMHTGVPSVYVPGKDLLQAFAKDLQEGAFRFIGYDELEAEATLVKGDRHLVVLDVTPFYGESGGQVGDQGILEVRGRQLAVHDTQKVGGLNVHILSEPIPTILGEPVRARVHVERRLAIMRNHTATHLLHAALRKILGTHVHQAGSLVAPDYLRFDFAHFSKVTDEDLAEIEELVNEKVRENIKLVHYRNIPFEEAKKMGALMFFGDKYGDRVNVVEFSDFSREFCGGTHVASTGEIGFFKLRAEGGVASGVRRVEAVTGDYAHELFKLRDHAAGERLEYAQQQLEQLSSLQRELAQLGSNVHTEAGNTLRGVEERIESLRRDLAVVRSQDVDLTQRFKKQSSLAAEIESIILNLVALKKTLEKELSKHRMKEISTEIDSMVQRAVWLDGIKVVSARVDVSSVDELKSLADTLRARLGSGVGLLATVLDDKVSLVCVVTDDLIRSKSLEAGKVVGAVAKLVGGGGGGKAHLATAGGKDISKLDHALHAAREIIESLLQPKATA